MWCSHEHVVRNNGLGLDMQCWLVVVGRRRHHRLPFSDTESLDQELIAWRHAQHGFTESKILDQKQISKSKHPGIPALLTSRFLHISLLELKLFARA